MFLLKIQINNVTPENIQNNKPSQASGDYLDDYLFTQLVNTLYAPDSTEAVMGGEVEAPQPYTKPVSTKPESTKPESIKPESTKPESTKPESTKPEPTPTPTQTQPGDDTSEYKKGDANNDGVIDKEDLKEIIKISKDDNFDPTDPAYDASDLNDDGLVDMEDVVIMKKRLKGPKGGDFNYDGTVDEVDAQMIQDFIDGKILFTQAESKVVGGKTGAAAYLKQMEKRFDKKAKGDVNGDGKIDAADIKLAEDFLYGRTVLTYAEKDAADVDDRAGFSIEDLRALKNLLKPRAKGDINGDGKINDADVDLLGKVDEEHLLSQAQLDAAGMTSNTISEKEKAIEALIKRFNVKRDGDINGDKHLTSADVDALTQIINDVKDKKTLLTDAEKLAFDFNGDNKVDSKDVEVLSKRFEKRTVKGDINKDGKIDQQDVNMLAAYFNGDMLLSKEEFWAADMNNDGELILHFDSNHPDQYAEKNDLYILAYLAEHGHLPTV